MRQRWWLFSCYLHSFYVWLLKLAKKNKHSSHLALVLGDIMWERDVKRETDKATEKTDDYGLSCKTHTKCVCAVTLKAVGTKIVLKFKGPVHNFSHFSSSQCYHHMIGVPGPGHIPGPQRMNHGLSQKSKWLLDCYFMFHIGWLGVSATGTKKWCTFS